MKKLLLLITTIIIISASAILIISSNPNQPEEVQNIPNAKIINGITYYRDEEKGIYIAIFKNKKLDYHYSTEADLLENTVDEEDYQLAINAGFFTPTYGHAGLLIQSGEPKYQLAPNDNQLTHVVILNENTSEVEFKQAKNFNTEEYKNKREYTLFQTGPLIIKDGEIKTDLINSSINGSGRYLRTFLGYTNRGEIFVGITQQTYDLETLGEEIRSLEVFKDKTISLVNLDGGSSTSMYSKDNEDFNYRITKILPAILGIK